MEIQTIDRGNAKAYLETLGYSFVKEGRCWFTKSPLNPSDSDPSFAIFPDGGWYCFSTKKGGDLRYLCKLLNKPTPTNLPAWVSHSSKKQEDWGGVIPSKYLDVTDDQRKAIDAYGQGRGIKEGYLHGVYFNKKGEVYEPRPSLMFLHQDENLQICGAKFRDISPVNKRFVVRGKLGFYVLESQGFGNKTLYLCESETSANSLWEYCKGTKRNAVVLSMGSVSSVPTMLPYAYQSIKGYVMIDYDGDDSKYNERIVLYGHLGLTPVKVKLPKGEDFNSMLVKGDIQLIENLI